MQSCILTELATINNEVKNFEENIKYVKLNVSPVSEFVIRQAKKCISDAYLWAHFESEAAMLSNSRCVQDVLINEGNNIKKLAFKCQLRFTSVFKILFEKKRKRE